MFKMFAAITVCAVAALTVSVVYAQTPTDERQAKGLMFGFHMMEGGKRSCNGFNGQTGVCVGQNECTKMNGKSVGKCFPFGSCCSVAPNSCGGYSDSSTSYFESSEKFQETCDYKINVRQNVCQIRIDFERFSLGQPTKPYNGSAYTCENDEFTLLVNDNTKMNMPVLCGENSGQHVYVPINPKTTLNDRQQITLKFKLTARDDDYEEPTPFWKLKISQLECQVAPTNWWKVKDIARQILKEKSAEDVKTTKYSLAPEGCLQYFADKDGSFESFNYNKGKGHYLGNLNYAVCFKRNLDTCGIKFEAVKFQIAYNQNLTNFTDRDCDTLKSVSESTTVAATTLAATTKAATTVAATAELVSTEWASIDNATEKVTVKYRDARKRKLPAVNSGVHSDYLLIPDGYYSETLFASKYCNKLLESYDNVKIKTQGPLYVAFVSDDYSSTTEDVEKGYKINYSLINMGC
ncbi:CUB domain [Cinara cedri]|uniref:CUB domain n=1 Tax=Cinara cedri TaxID=506608 RepID=A0A5E4MKS8_9HEMI|nr:CUB domain [Cinara cedri]